MPINVLLTEDGSLDPSWRWVEWNVLSIYWPQGVGWIPRQDRLEDIITWSLLLSVSQMCMILMWIWHHICHLTSNLKEALKQHWANPKLHRSEPWNSFWTPESFWILSNNFWILGNNVWIRRHSFWIRQYSFRIRRVVSESDVQFLNPEFLNPVEFLNPTLFH